MSKFIHQLREFRLVEHARQVAIPGELTTIEQDEPEPDSGRSATWYRVRATCGAQVLIDNREDHENKRSVVMDMIRHSIAHEVYSDVRVGVLEIFPDLLDLKQSDLRNWHAVKRIEDKLNAIMQAITP